ncbi:MAG TPA: alpha/beta hydrolase [Mesotoga infera]|uniref:Alpha/beta hydrolase n=1 Tax=Mesotoga infera TaxID=1236046 RepID=A0A7C1H6N7_9BACT|nr:alpha/beta hydrolase [Mesotoga infera]
MKVFKALFFILLIGLALLVVNSIFSVTMARIYFNRIERDGRYLKVDEEELFLKIVGEGKPILMIHGFPGSHIEFQELAELLSANRRIYIIDLPGFGLSTASNKGDYSVKGYADLTVDLMDLLNIEKADIIGHSLGGEIGLNIAYYYPERIESLVLIDASPYGERDFLPDFLSSSKILTWTVMRFFYQTYPIQRFIYLKKLGDRNNFESEEFGKYFALVDRMTASFLYEFMRGNDRGPFSQSLVEIDCSALILWGELDEISPLDYGEKLTRELSNSVLKVIEGAGHAPFIEFPMRVAEEITGFLE